jgi:hypothetical protein
VNGSLSFNLSSLCAEGEVFPVGGKGLTGKELGVLYLSVFDAFREQWREKEEELLRCPLYMEIR